jgi:hypothetical protein
MPPENDASYNLTKGVMVLPHLTDTHSVRLCNGGYQRLKLIELITQRSLVRI